MLNIIGEYVDQDIRKVLEWQDSEDRGRQEKYKIFRDYYEGNQKVMLSERQRAYLQIHNEIDFRANYCPLVVNGPVRRLKVRGFDHGIFDTWWTKDNMDLKQIDAYVSAVRDGDTYIIVSWDNEEKRPVFSPNLAFDGQSGVSVIYNDEDNTISKAIKTWRVQEPGGPAYIRINIYTEDKIQRYISSTNGWKGYTEDGQPATIEWVDSEGKPLGVPVVHMTYNRRGYRWGLSILDSVVPMQDALNKSIVGLLGAADTTSFRLMTMLGGDPVDADGNPLQIAPGSFISMKNPPGEGQIGFIPGEDLRPLVEVVDSFKINIAQITGTPLHLFQVSGQNASEGSQKQQEVSMIARVEDASVEFGNAWEKCMDIAATLHNTFSNGPKVFRDHNVQTLWSDFEVRNKEDRNQQKALTFKTLVDAGARPEVAAELAGYTDKEAEKLKKVNRVLLEDVLDTGEPPEGEPTR